MSRGSLQNAKARAEVFTAVNGRLIQAPHDSFRLHMIGSRKGNSLQGLLYVALASGSLTLTRC